MSCQRMFFYNYDPTNTATFGKFGEESLGRGFAETSGSSTTVTGETDSLDSFAPVVVGAFIKFKTADQTTALRTVATKVSVDEITISSAIDTTGCPFYFANFYSGTGATDGWVYVGDLKDKVVKYNLRTLASTTVEMIIYGKLDYQDNTADSVVATITLSATGSDTITISEPWSYLRVSLRTTAGGAAGDAMDVFVTGRPLGLA
jgi:hypothetical protein